MTYHKFLKVTYHWFNRSLLIRGCDCTWLPIPSQYEIAPKNAEASPEHIPYLYVLTHWLTPMIQNTACVFASISIDHPWSSWKNQTMRAQITMIEASPYHHDILDPFLFPLIWMFPKMGLHPVIIQILGPSISKRIETYWNRLGETSRKPILKPPSDIIWL